jgi:hypothetical protein
MIEKIDKIQALLNVPNVDADTETAITNMKILNLLVDLRAEAEQLILPGVVGQSEQLADNKSYQPCDGCNTSCKKWDIFFCKKLG